MTLNCFVAYEDFTEAFFPSLWNSQLELWVIALSFLLVRISLGSSVHTTVLKSYYYSYYRCITRTLLPLQFLQYGSNNKTSVNIPYSVLAFDGNLFALKVVHITQENFLPVASVADESEVRERPFRRSHLLLHFRQQITYRDQKNKQAVRDAWRCN